MHDINKLALAEAYCQFQKTSPSPFHAVTTVTSTLRAAGYKELPWAEKWQLKAGGFYYVVHSDGKSVIAFGVGEAAPSDKGFSIVCAHTDSPTLRLRLNPWQEDNSCVRLLTQNHGGLIERSWFDRPLILAGAVYSLERKGGKIVFAKETGLPRMQTRLVSSTKPLAIIPDLAIHLDRLKNTQGAINPEIMLSAIVGVGQPATTLRKMLPEALGLPTGTVLDGFELCLAPYWDHTIAGLDDSLIVGPRHDDLAMVFAGLQAMSAHVRNVPANGKTPIIAFFDAEETGSRTASGAASAFTRDTLRRIARHHPASDAKMELDTAFSKSFVVSADMAHAYHPSYPEKFDFNHRLLINGGLVIKENADDRYATSGHSGTLFKGICEAAGIPLQKYIHRQDLGCGSTIGPFMAAALTCHTVDVGLAMWAMHSTAETMGVHDLAHAVKAFSTFLNGGI